jgi:hypothetical protein
VYGLSVSFQSAVAGETGTMNLTRRELVAGCAAGAIFPTAACAARAAGPQITPEAFGAVGDGVTDDYVAFQRMVAAVNAAGGGTVTFRPGRNYLLDRFVTKDNRVSDITFQGCSGLTIEGNGAVISVKGDFFRDVRTTRSLTGLRFEDCANVQIRELQLVGNVQRMTRPPTLAEAPSHGLLFGGCSDVVLDGVLARHFAADGLYITSTRKSDGSGARKASRNFTIRRSKSLFNARQALTVVQLRDATFENCEFGFTGYIDEGSNQGDYGAHAPSASVDIEPNASPYTSRPVDVMTGNLHFHSCVMRGSFGGTFLAGQYSNCSRSIENVTLDSCRLECNPVQQQGRYGFIFDVQGGLVTNCTLRMYNKTAFIGWYKDSDAQVIFRGNTVYGGNSAANSPIFSVRPTRGRPLIERNRILDERREPIQASGSWLVSLDNPLATVRGNIFFLPSQAYRSTSRGNSMPAIYLNVALAEGNEYQTNLESQGGFEIVYTLQTVARDEKFSDLNGQISSRVRAVRRTAQTAASHDREALQTLPADRTQIPPPLTRPAPLSVAQSAHQEGD